MVDLEVDSVVAEEVAAVVVMEVVAMEVMVVESLEEGEGEAVVSKLSI